MYSSSLLSCTSSFCALCVCLGSLFHCTGQAVLSQLPNNRVQYILKGTYESNNPYDWQKIHQNDYMASQPAPINEVVSMENFRIYLDFAEAGLSTSNGGAHELTDDNVQIFSHKRFTLCSTDRNNNNQEFLDCTETSGKAKLDQLFGEGLKIDSDDIKADTYRSIAIFPRRMVTAPAFRYTTSATFNLNVYFDSAEDTQGRNLPNFYTYSTADDPSNIKRTPLHQNQLELEVKDDQYPYVIEARVFLKNLMMSHAIEYPNRTDGQRDFFIGPSDWFQQHLYNNEEEPDSKAPANYQRLGGNILTTARIYRPDNASTLVITSPLTCSGGGLAYFALLISGSSFEKTRLPVAATRLENGARIENLTPADYDLYVTHDKKQSTSEGEADGEDGFPESHQACTGEGGQITIGSSETKTITPNCTCPS